MKNFLLTILFVFSLALSSCLKTPATSVIPEIEFKSFSTGDTIEPTLNNKARYVRLNISFTDGDGDLGLDQSEIQAPYDLNGGYYYNLLATYYKQENGVFVRYNQSGARIPRLTSYSGKNGLHGVIIENFLVLEKGAVKIQYEIFIYDRALHKSNVITTPAIQLN